MIHIFLKALNAFQPHQLNPVAVFLFSIEPSGSGERGAASYSQALVLRDSSTTLIFSGEATQHRGFSECIHVFLFSVVEELMRCSAESHAHQAVSEGEVILPLYSKTDEPTCGVLCLFQNSSVQERHEHTAESSSKDFRMIKVADCPS